MAIVVDEPIINSPFVEPTRYYRMHQGAPELRRRRAGPSGSMPGLRTRGGQADAPGGGVRRAAARQRHPGRGWRAGARRGIQAHRRTTLDLFRQWTAPGRERSSSSASSRPPRPRSGSSRGRRGRDEPPRRIEQQERYVRPLPEDGHRFGQDRRHGHAHRLERAQQGPPARGPAATRTASSWSAPTAHLLRSAWGVRDQPTPGNSTKHDPRPHPAAGDLARGQDHGHELACAGAARRRAPARRGATRSAVRGRLRQPRAARRPRVQGQPPRHQRRGTPRLVLGPQGGRVRLKGARATAGGGADDRLAGRRRGGGARLAKRSGP